jgi:hypothetical protein
MSLREALGFAEETWIGFRTLERGRSSPMRPGTGRIGFS